ncbi:type IV secretory system conjugative DNA transfer family protein [Spirosoma pulveris]
MPMDIFDLDTPLIQFPSSYGTDSFTIRNAVEGVQIFGGIGSGKTSGSGRLWALRYLLANFGGLILTVKPDELDMWKELCQLTGREQDLVVIEPNGATFNFLDEASRGSEEVTDTANIVDLLQTIIQAGALQDGGKSNDTFWVDSFDLLLRNAVDLTRLAYGKISVQVLHDIVVNVPKVDVARQSANDNVNAFERAFEAARVNVTAQIEAWHATLSREEQNLLQDDTAYDNALMDAVADARLLKFVDNFFSDTLYNLSDKTRSIIEMMFQSFLLRLLREPFYSLFCRHASTVTPEDCLNGKIVIVNLPVKLYQKSGRDAQLIVKYCFQSAWEKRNVKLNGRPVFLWCDESHVLIHDKDAEFQATARSSRVATVYLSQNLPNYIASMGGHTPEHRVRAFLGTLSTKIFSANADTETNEYASKLIGDGFIIDKSKNTTTASSSFSQSFGESHRLERMVRPEQFSKLRTGGPRNNHRVEAYMHRQGDCFCNGLNHLRLIFNQNCQL